MNTKQALIEVCRFLCSEQEVIGEALFKNAVMVEPDFTDMRFLEELKDAVMFYNGIEAEEIKLIRATVLRLWLNENSPRCELSNLLGKLATLETVERILRDPERYKYAYEVLRVSRYRTSAEKLFESLLFNLYAKDYDLMQFIIDEAEYTEFMKTQVQALLRGWRSELPRKLEVSAICYLLRHKKHGFGRKMSSLLMSAVNVEEVSIEAIRALSECETKFPVEFFNEYQILYYELIGSDDVGLLRFMADIVKLTIENISEVNVDTIWTLAETYVMSEGAPLPKEYWYTKDSKMVVFAFSVSIARAKYSYAPTDAFEVKEMLSSIKDTKVMGDLLEHLYLQYQSLQGQKWYIKRIFDGLCIQEKALTGQKARDMLATLRLLYK